MNDEQLFCRDCAHFKAANPILYWGKDRYEYARCFAPHNVSGSGLIHPLLEKGAYCAIVRRNPDLCGPTGRWFDAR